MRFSTFIYVTLLLIATVIASHAHAATGDKDEVIFSCNVIDNLNPTVTLVELTRNDIEYAYVAQTRLANSDQIEILARINQSIPQEDGSLDQTMTLSIVERDSLKKVIDSKSFVAHTGDSKKLLDAVTFYDALVKCQVNLL